MESHVERLILLREHDGATLVVWVMPTASAEWNRMADIAVAFGEGWVLGSGEHAYIVDVLPGAAVENSGTVWASLDSYEWDGEDSAKACSEGWDVFWTDERGYEIERIDAPEDGSEPVFDGDDAALEFVLSRARNGHSLERQALAMCRIAVDFKRV